MCFLTVLEKYNKQLTSKYIEKYTSLIKKHKTFLEVYNPDGKPYKSIFYITDEAMVWVSIVLYLNKKLKKQKKSR